MKCHKITSYLFKLTNFKEFQALKTIPGLTEFYQVTEAFLMNTHITRELSPWKHAYTVLTPLNPTFIQ